MDLLREFLYDRANNGRLATYTEGANVLCLSPGDPDYWRALGDLSRKTYDECGLMITAIVIADGRTSPHRGSPGAEFYTLAKELGRGEEIELRGGELAFWANEVRSIHERRWHKTGE